MSKKRVFVDTNAIIPCVSAGEWKRLCGHYAVETVNTVVDETQRGDITRREYVVIDKAMLLRTLASVHDTTHKARADFRERLKKLEPKLELDAGERDLLAHIMAREKPAPNILILTMSDRAAVRACCALEWGDCLVSIERLLKDAGAPPKALGQLQDHHREAWLTTVRTGFRLGLVK
jgi:hypothetical protein